MKSWSTEAVLLFCRRQGKIPIGRLYLLTQLHQSIAATNASVEQWYVHTIVTSSIAEISNIAETIAESTSKPIHKIATA